MLRNFALPALVVAVAVTVPALAQTKLAIINTQRAVLETAEMKKAAADLEAKFKPQTTEIEKRTKELQAIQDKLADPSKLKPEEGADLQADGQRKQRVLQRLTDDIQAQVNQEREEILQRGGQRMQDVVAKLAEEKGLDLVIDVSNAVFFKPTLDITNEAIASYDKKFPLK